MQRPISALAACCLLVCSSASAQNKSLDHLLTGETVFVWSWSGNESTVDAYQQTASYKAFHESGLVPAFVKVGDSIPWTQLAAASGEEYRISWEELKLAWDFVHNCGAAVTVGIRGDNAENARPYGLAVVHKAGFFAPAIEILYQQLEKTEEARGGSVPQVDSSAFNLPTIGLPFGIVRLATEADQGLTDEEERREISERFERIGFQEPDAPLRAPRPAPSQAPAEDGTIEKLTIGAREVYRVSGLLDPDFPNLEFAWWAEGDDLVLYYGMCPVTEYLEGLQPEANQLVKTELWQSAFETKTAGPEAGNLAETSRVWLNIERIVQLYADVPIDDPEIPFKTIREVIGPSGLLGLRAIGSRSGYRGRNLVSITQTVTESPRKGLLSLSDEATCTLDDLPPLPVNVSAFTVRAIDAGRTYREVRTLLEQYLKLCGTEGEHFWEMVQQQSRASGGFDPEKDLLAHLGHVAVTYDDTKQEVLGWGTSAVAIAVTDPDALLAGINRWRDSSDEDPESNIRILRRERRGYTIFAVTGSKSFFSPSFAVSGNWLVIGWQPQTVEAFQLRAAGELPVWSPDKLAKENRALIPQKVQQLEYSDPRSIVRTSVSLAPWALEGMRWSANQADEMGIEWNPEVSSLDIPPAELIVKPLYPNLTVTRVSATVIHTERWASSNVDKVWWLLGAYCCGVAMFAE